MCTFCRLSKANAHDCLGRIMLFIRVSASKAKVMSTQSRHWLQLIIDRDDVFSRGSWVLQVSEPLLYGKKRNGLKAVLRS